MEHEIHFPYYANVVGEVLISENNGIKIKKFFVEGIHGELRYLGSVTFHQKDDGWMETMVTVTSGLPTEGFLG